MITPSQIWEAADCELIFAVQEIQKELNLRAMCNSQDLPYPPTEEVGPEYVPPFADLDEERRLMDELGHQDTPMFAETYGG